MSATPRVASAGEPEQSTAIAVGHAVRCSAIASATPRPANARLSCRSSDRAGDPARPRSRARARECVDRPPRRSTSRRTVRARTGCRPSNDVARAAPTATLNSAPSATPTRQSSADDDTRTPASNPEPPGRRSPEPRRPRTWRFPRSLRRGSFVSLARVIRDASFGG